MFSFFKRKKEEAPYAPQFGEPAETVDEFEEIKEPEESEEEPVTLEDGRVFPAAFVREIRAYEAEDLKTILCEQGEFYSPEEYAYIEEVFHERLGDL